MTDEAGSPEVFRILLDELSKRLDERHQTQQEEIKAGDAELRRHIDQRIADAFTSRKQRDAMLDERYDTQNRAVEAALKAQEMAVHTAREADQKAVDKALEAAEKAVDRRQDQSDKEFHEHLEQVRHENKLALESADKLVYERFEASDKAISKAEVANEKRFEGVNEFRAQLADQTSTFIPREVAEATFKELRAKIEGLQRSVDTTSGKSSGYQTFWAVGIAALTLLIAVVVASNAVFGK